jgi:hypothetical protein
MTSISLLVINYHSAFLAADAIRTARAASSGPLQTVVVDNSDDPMEVEALRGIAFLVRDRNWNTPSPRLSHLKVHQTEEGFRASFEARHKDGLQ